MELDPRIQPSQIISTTAGVKISIRSFWPGIVWFILSTIAFCLPGSTLPKSEWFAVIQLDKWIHVGIFSVMIFLWCLPLFHKAIIQPNLTKLLIWISMAFLSYGILMEFVQHFFIPNRSFDMGDIAADAAGCLVGFLLVRRQQRSVK